MRVPKVLTLILAGGEGSRLEVLTERRAKPAMPFAGTYRLIDFPLSNCMHSELSEVWVIQQYEPYSIVDHLANGRPWDLDRTYGGLRILHPHTGDRTGGFHKGNADAIHRNRAYIEEFRPEVLLVLSADHVYKLDYRDVVERHIETGADLTIVTTEVPAEEATRFGIVQTHGDRVTDYAYKPAEPKSSTAATEVFVFRPDALLDRLADLAAEKARSDSDDDEDTVEDLGDETLPSLVGEGRASAFPFEGYWRDVGTVDSYWHAHMELATATAAIDLDDPAWRIRTLGSERSPASVTEGATIARSLLSPGCTVHGIVLRSVLSPGVVVRDGATVIDSVILHDTEIGEGAEVSGAIVDRAVRVGEKARIGRGAGPRTTAEDIAIVGMGVSISDGAEIARGARLEPGASA
jgi:glucose-1-phosphate adenylyltransferase